LLGLSAAALACGQAQVTEAPTGAASGCASCHTAPGEGPPFRDRTGSTDSNRLTVGSHNVHLAPIVSGVVACGSCHHVPKAVNQPGHMDAPPDEVVQFGGLAKTGGVNPVWNGSSCAASYCHGNFPGGNTNNTPTWLPAASTTQVACGTCHGVPPPTGQHQLHFSNGVDCAKCHPFKPETHVNGVKDVSIPSWDATARTCAASCHQGATKNW
jgi:hypothetical protein